MLAACGKMSSSTSVVGRKMLVSLGEKEGLVVCWWIANAKYLRNTVLYCTYAVKLELGNGKELELLGFVLHTMSLWYYLAGIGTAMYCSVCLFWRADPIDWTATNSSMLNARPPALLGRGACKKPASEVNSYKGPTYQGAWSVPPDRSEAGPSRGQPCFTSLLKSSMPPSIRLHSQSSRNADALFRTSSQSRTESTSLLTLADAVTGIFSRLADPETM